MTRIKNIYYTKSSAKHKIFHLVIRSYITVLLHFSQVLPFRNYNLLKFKIMCGKIMRGNRYLTLKVCVNVFNVKMYSIC